MDRLERIEHAIQGCSDKKTLRLLNRAWWKEFLMPEKVIEDVAKYLHFHVEEFSHGNGTVCACSMCRANAEKIVWMVREGQKQQEATQ